MRPAEELVRLLLLLLLASDCSMSEMLSTMTPALARVYPPDSSITMGACSRCANCHTAASRCATPCGDMLSLRGQHTGHS
jgi:hypothetical protein